MGGKLNKIRAEMVSTLKIFETLFPPKYKEPLIIRQLKDMEMKE